mmetsp:Transcript_6128/g.10738  ORF Transcript_6128/g.10738 Transcript_6128/m.10738 type:complete len:221 (+) Transcript_6128:101-763(+)
MKRTNTERWETLAKILTCPNCFEVVKGIYLSCSKGHLYCESCSRIINRCILCHGTNPPKVNERNLLLEELRNSARFPCQWEGCTHTSTILEVVEHEAACEFKHILCLLCGDNECFPKTKLEAHIKHDHKAKPIARKKGSYSFMIPQDGDEIHKVLNLRNITVALAIEYEDGEAFFNVQVIGEGSFSMALNDYSFTIEGWTSKFVKAMKLKGTTKVTVKLS